MWGAVNRSIFKRTSTFFVAVALGSFFFERAIDTTAYAIFERINKGKLYEHVKDRFGPPS